MNIKKLSVVVALAFIHFRDPATDAPMFKTDDNGEFVKDADGNKLPIGVKVYGPGSTQYRNAQAAIQTENIKAGKKGLTGNRIQRNETELLARTTVEYVNFDYEGASASYETNLKFYEDVEVAHLRDQVSEKQADYGNFLPNAATA